MSDSTTQIIEKIRRMREAISHMKEAARLLGLADSDPDDIKVQQTLIQLTQFDVDDIIARHFPVTTFKAPQVGIFRGE